MELIASTTLSSDNSSISFSSIPGTYTDLVMYISARTNSSTYGFGYNNVQVKINGANSSFSSRNLADDNGSIATYSDSVIRLDVPSAQNTANTFSNTRIYIQRYTAGISKHISVDHSFESSGGYFQMQTNNALWSNGNAITSIDYYCLDRSFVAGSTASLYGITKGSGGATIS